MDNLARFLNARFREDTRLKAKVTKRKELILAKPYTFMNLSGFSVKRIVDRFNLSTRDILVICDDMDLPLGRIRLRPKGGSGGHNGLNSLIEALNTEDFPRLRLGIGRPCESEDASSFVLLKFSGNETSVIKEVIYCASQCALDWSRQDIEKVMSKYNSIGFDKDSKEETKGLN